jgi:hypothetical protein
MRQLITFQASALLGALLFANACATGSVNHRQSPAATRAASASAKQIQVRIYDSTGHQSFSIYAADSEELNRILEDHCVTQVDLAWESQGETGPAYEYEDLSVGSITREHFDWLVTPEVAVMKFIQTSGYDRNGACAAPRS